jgi:two-component system LytT family response regulator
MRILIVDDERPARDKLRRLLTQLVGPDALIIEAIDGVAALESIARTAPEVVFLDIQMPEINGLEVAASLPATPGQVPPLIVFVTAYDQYAIAAFDANAIDYLLKPFDCARLQRAWQRVQERLLLRGATATSASAPTQVRLPAPESPPEPTTEPAPASMPLSAAGPINHLLVSERGVTRVLQVDAIEWLETADNYVVLHLDQSAQQPLLRQTLAALLETLGPRFMRCHRRAAVRVAAIDSVIAKGKGDCELVLRSGTRVSCSRQYSAALMQQLPQG